MVPAARLSAAIEILDEIASRRRPASDALKDWGLAHRFAGSGDRSAISALVHDALRRRSSSAFLMGEDSGRAVILGMLRQTRQMELSEVAGLFDGSRFAPSPLTEQEVKALNATSLDDAPAWVAGDYPEWLDPHFAEAFGESRVAELTMLTHRAPVDLRVNTLKASPELALASIAYLGAQRCVYSPFGIRILPKEDGRPISVQSEPGFQKGHFEIQDEGSQLAALIAAPDPGAQVVDLCAGGGGKTLALAALMDNRGQIFATDSDKRRLAPIFDRLTRAGVRNVQVRSPKGKDDEPLQGLEGQADCVLVDAPCSGSGTWRRNPDAKWRIRPNALDDRIKEQAAVLDRAARYVKPGGRLVYVTCSLLPVENDGAVSGFLARNAAFQTIDPSQTAFDAGLDALAPCVSRAGLGLQLTPKRTATDGFFISVMKRIGRGTGGRDDADA